MLQLRKSLLAGLGLASMASAVTPIPDSEMTDYLNAGGRDLALRAQPLWFFGQAKNQPPCIPTAAYDSNNTQTPSASLCYWPDTGCNCRTPDVPIGNPSPWFPVYYTYEKCTDTEVRVQYSLFYEKDGFLPYGTAGHRYDWERMIVAWGLGDDGNWRQNYALFSQHKGYKNIPWASIQNTINKGEWTLPRGGEDGRQNLDHPKVYVAWSKHANFDTRNTAWDDVGSQISGHAFRSNDWWYFNAPTDYIRCDWSTECGQLTGSMEWGDATSYPPSVHDTLCSAK